MDDHSAVRRGVVGMLHDMGWTKTHEAATLAQGLQLARTCAWTLAVIDLHLPDGDGLDFIAAVREAGSVQPILVHSQVPDAAAASRVFKAGGNGFINKGSGCEDFELAVRKVASGGRYISPSYAEELAMGMGGGAPTHPHETLSEREYQVMCLIAAGNTPTKVAEALGCSVNSISTYRSRILQKLNLKNSLDIVRYALSRKLVAL